MINTFRSLIVKHFVVVFLIVFLSCAPPKSLFSLEGHPGLMNKINKIIEASGIDLNMGIKIVSLKNNVTLFAYNSQKLLMPASTNKLYTCAAALHYLGKDYTFKTRLLKNKNNLLLKGGADPDLKIEQLDSLAKIISRSIKMVDTLFIDDTFLDSLNYGEGWMWDEGPWWYAAPISALSVNDNCIDFYIEPGKVGKTAKIDHFPKTSYITFENNSITVADTLDFKKIEIDRDWVSNKNNFTVAGEILDTTKKDTLFRNIYDPSLFTGTVFKELFKKYGTNVKQLSRKPQDLTNYKEFATHYSDSLIVSAKNLMYLSDNLTAELFVKSIGALDTIPGTWKTGLDSVKSFLAEQVKIDTSQINLADGSGVSRYTLTSSDHLVSLLTWVYNSNHKNDFISTLPGGGSLNSTLEKRLIKEGHKVRAKTGGLSGVRNLAGYIDSHKYGPVAFSILMNGYIGSSSKHRYVQNQIIKTIIYD
jgi:D-alanyl-D-alanine carboxypeptidase/D-alanyl-D-alanine-endopeptidase (penicillin-binding protein 4)